MINPIYRFFVNGLLMDPSYSADDLTKEYELETNERFYRAKLSGKISFLREEFDHLHAQPFETEFIVTIEISFDQGLAWIPYFVGKFMKTDARWDVDHRIVTVQPDVKDQYNDVLAGLEKEYDLIKLAPAIEPLIVQRRPLIQVYIPGDNVVSCFLGGTYWEQDASAVTDTVALEQTYHFTLSNLLKEINITVDGSPIFASGLYTGRMSLQIDGSTEKMIGNLTMRGNSDYRLYVEQVKVGGVWNLSGLKVFLYQTSDNSLLFEFQSISENPWDNADFTMTAVNGIGTAAAEMSTYRIYARYLLDVESIDGLPTYPLPENDIVGNNRNYQRAIGYAVDVAYLSTNFSAEPTEWGRADSGLYFMPPPSLYGQQFFPIARSTWRYASLWFAFHAYDLSLEEKGRKAYVLRDTYPVSSAISVLLKQFAPGITHEATPDYSQFFYSGVNPVSFQNFKLLIAQKTNLLVGDYDQPAQKAMATLQQFTNMLRDCFKCFWFVEDGKFRIEHVSWFKNGGSYSGSAQIQFDLTAIENVRNNKKWGYDSSAWEYDKIDLAERFQFSWMDDVTPAFEGVPIQVLSKYVTEGKVEDVAVSNFTTDVDYMMLNPNSIAQDGFALFAAVTANALLNPDELFSGSEGTNGNTAPTYQIRPELRGRPANARFEASSNASGATGQVVFYAGGNVISTQGNFILTQNNQNFSIPVTIPPNAEFGGFVVAGYGSFSFYDLDVPGSFELPFVTRSVQGVDYVMQNGYMSFAVLQPNYYLHDLPARRVLINNEQSIVLGIERKKKQTVIFPSLQDPDPMKLIKTYLGNGQVDKISINLHSRTNKITLKYDTE